MPVSIFSVKATTELESIHPSIDILIEIQYRETFDIPISIQGVVAGEDKRTLGHIFEIPTRNANQIQLKAVNYTQQTNQRMLSLHKTFRLVLDQKMLDHIEYLRERNRKRDVILQLDLTVSYLDGRMEIGSYNIQSTNVPDPNQPGRMKQVDLIALASSNPFLAQGHLRMLIPSHDNSYLGFREEPTTIYHTIKGSDWVNDFQPQLGVGKFLVMEIPEVISVSEPKDEIDERLHSASHHLLEIRESVRKGEWEQVAEDCRNIYEDLRKNFIKEFDSLVQKLLRDDNGISDKGIGDFMKMIEGQNGFIHEFHHIRDQDGKVKKISVHKEDAYALYISLVGLVNMLTTKYHRLKKLESKQYN